MAPGESAANPALPVGEEGEYSSTAVAMDVVFKIHLKWAAGSSLQVHIVALDDGPLMTCLHVVYSTELTRQGIVAGMSLTPAFSCNC